MKKPTVFADFNNRDQEGCLRLNTVGTIEDLAKYSIELKEGDSFVVSDGDLVAEIVVRAPGSEGLWRGRIVVGPFEVAEYDQRKPSKGDGS